MSDTGKRTLRNGILISPALREQLGKSCVMSWQHTVQCRYFEDNKKHGLRNRRLSLLQVALPKNDVSIRGKLGEMRVVLELLVQFIPLNRTVLKILTLKKL